MMMWSDCHINFKYEHKTHLFTLLSSDLGTAAPVSAEVGHPSKITCVFCRLKGLHNKTRIDNLAYAYDVTPARSLSLWELHIGPATLGPILGNEFIMISSFVKNIEYL